jgi:outer membrane lipoprotein
MAMNTVRSSCMMVVVMMLISGCNRHHVIPDSLKNQVNRAVTFDQVKNAPSSYRGELVVLGGKVLSVTRVEDTTRVEVLQLPLTQDLAPVMEGSQSEGRFVAFDTQQTIIDPAILKPGIPVTVVGEVKSSTYGHVGDRQYELPTLGIRDMTVWEDKTEPAPLTYYGSPHGYGYRPYYFSGIYGVHGLD